MILNSNNKLKPFKAIHSALLYTRSISVTPRVVPTSLVLSLNILKDNYFIPSDKLKNGDNILKSFIISYIVAFGPLSRKDTAALAAFKMIASFIIFPFVLSSSFYNYIFESQFRVYLPAYMQCFIDTICKPVRSVQSTDNTIGTVHISGSILDVVEILDTWNLEFFRVIFRETSFSFLFTNEKSASEFTNFFNVFKDSLKECVDIDGRTNYLALARLCNVIFTDIQSTLKKSESMKLVQSNFSKENSTSLDVYKFRNYKSCSSRKYLIYKKGIPSLNTSNAYYVIFYLFLGEFFQVKYNPNPYDNYAEEQLLGGGYPIAHDFLVDLNDLTENEVFTAMLSVSASKPSTASDIPNPKRQQKPSGSGKPVLSKQNVAASLDSDYVVPGSQGTRHYSTGIANLSASKVRYKFNYFLTGVTYDLLL